MGRPAFGATIVATIFVGLVILIIVGITVIIIIVRVIQVEFIFQLGADAFGGRPQSSTYTAGSVGVSAEVYGADIENVCDQNGANNVAIRGLLKFI
jgi:hypothetical protein